MPIDEYGQEDSNNAHNAGQLHFGHYPCSPSPSPRSRNRELPRLSLSSLQPLDIPFASACSFGAASSADLLVGRIVFSFFGLHLAKFATRDGLRVALEPSFP